MQDVSSEPDREGKEYNLSSISTCKSSSVFLSHLLHCSSIHALSGWVPRRMSPPLFKGIMFDTGAAHASSGNIAQYTAYCSFTGSKPGIDTKRRALVKFEIGEEHSKRMAKIQFSTDDNWLSFEMRIVDADVPILISIDNMDLIEVYFNNLSN